jgi:hypothetical protein
MATFFEATMQVRMFSLRAHAQVMNEIHRDTMFYIRDMFLPFHFSTEAYRRYPSVFEKRSKRWQLFKARTVHHQRPNVFTGALRQAVMETVPRATATRGTFHAQAPMDSVVKYGRLAGKTIRRPLNEQRRKELEFVSHDEIEFLAQRMADQYVAASFDPRWQETVLRRYRSGAFLV